MDNTNWRIQCKHRLGFGAVCILVLTAIGCGGTNTDGMFAAATDSNAKRLGTLYAQFQLLNQEARLLGPADKDEFVEFIKSKNSTELERIGVDVNDLENVFVSERDQMPFKIRWEVKGVMRGPAQPVIFESEGRDGKFVVGFTGFVAKEVDKAEYDRLWSGAADEEGKDSRGNQR